MIRSALLWLLLAISFACGPGSERVLVAAGTTLVDSGLMDALADRYEESHPGIQISVTGESTKLILEMGRQGVADLLVVHAPEQEREFVADGYSRSGATVMESRFVVIGPPELARQFAGWSVSDVFARVAADGLTFVSRGDGSGTHDRELAIWSDIGIDPSGQSWYLDTGQGMGPTIQVADQREGVALAEYGSYLAAAEAITLVDMELDIADLGNPYSAYIVSGAASEATATAFFNWLLSPDGVSAIIDVNRKLFGQVVYQPAPG